MFTLHPQLAADTIQIIEWPLSLVLLAKDSHYPWCILVPKRENVREIYHLNQADRTQLLAESCYLAETMEAIFTPVKMNVAALGNVVPQLHLHHIARFQDDAAWPKPIWGVVESGVYTQEVLQERVAVLAQRCALFSESV
jgi:diadenosine tetraphosphate (Ap4A) HIT family hydrolase